MAQVWPAVCNRFQALVIKPSGMITNRKNLYELSVKNYNQKQKINRPRSQELSQETHMVSEMTVCQRTYHGNIGGTRSVRSFLHAHKAHNASGQAGNESLM